MKKIPIATSKSIYGGASYSDYCHGHKIMYPRVIHTKLITGTGADHDEAIRNYNTNMRNHINGAPHSTHNGKIV